MNFDIINAIPVPAFLVSEKDTLAEANEAFRDMFPQAQIGRSYLTVLRQPKLVELIESAKAGEHPDPVELETMGRAQIYFRATGGKLGDSVLVCLQDMNETATAIRMRQNFVADLGHELKTPLTAISGILETSAGDASAIEHFLPALTGEVNRMKRLVADLLTLSRVESNAKRVPNREIDLQNVIEEASAAMTRLSKEMDAPIELDLPAAPIRFPGNPDEIVRAVKNLIENGLLYGAPGHCVTVTGRVEDAGVAGGSPDVVIEVANTGAGVESHHLPRLTERFYRVDGHRSRVSGGSGLGLAIVKHVVNHHRGRMTIENKSDQGFSVTLYLPVTQTDR